MPRTSRFPPEVRERAVRLVREHQGRDPLPVPAPIPYLYYIYFGFDSGPLNAGAPKNLPRS
jgi:hypothetical protein